MERYVIRGGVEGYERLKLLAEARWPDTSELLTRAGISSGMRSLDVGCGGGEVTFEIARLVGPDALVTGIDMDTVKLQLGRDAAREAGVANVEFRLANVNEWNEPDTYDFVFCRFVLQHLTRPMELLRRMWAAVRPGGVMVVEDADFEGRFCEPSNPGFEFYRLTYPRLLAARGGDATTGRKLYRYFLDLGIPGPDLKLVQRADGSGRAKRLSLATLEATAEAIVAEGFASEAEVRLAIVSLTEFTNDPSTVIGDPRVFQVFARRAKELPSPDNE